MNNNHRVIIISAPSGAGKSTLAKWLLERFPQLEFSVSATSRAPRGEEQDGREYYFISNEEFEKKIQCNAFVEWEEVYQSVCYGTLKSELERIWGRGHSILFDVDVKGGVRLKQLFGKQAISIFIQPPSLQSLQERLEKRGTDSPESIQKRLSKAQEEMTYASQYDTVIINDHFEKAKTEIEMAVSGFLASPPLRCGLYFGSFNPLHAGHMAIANYMLEFTDLDEVRLVLSPMNPLKEGVEVLPLDDRLKRMQRAVEQTGLPISVSTVEFTLPQPYYTISTLRHVATAEPHVRFVLIMGADNLAVIEKWHKWRELLQEFEVYVYPRNGYDAETLCKAYRTTYIDAPVIDVSSSFIRKGLAEGKNMNGFLAGV
jgi:guanylate kinase